MPGAIEGGRIIVTSPCEAHPQPRHQFGIMWRAHRDGVRAAYDHSHRQLGGFDSFFSWLTKHIRPRTFLPKGHAALRYKSALRAEAKQIYRAAPSDSLLFDVRICVVMGRPKSHFLKSGLRKNAPRWHGAHRGDNDNFEKAAWDALSGVIWADDRQIVSNSTVRRWADPGELPCVVVSIGIVGDLTIDQACSWAAPYVRREEEFPF